MNSSRGVAWPFGSALGLGVGTVLLSAALAPLVITIPGCTIAGVPGAGGGNGNGGDGQPGDSGGTPAPPSSVFAIVGE